ncbi:hypothetical protein B0H17DRAFT_1126456 [Mycena rosella]|uniref:Uncharacterized protein n=1 Tax=Mycena rosella TaxID=1033263 RepID=A0AAD7M7M6_MYCRO|nr:hypothetical protein B0H17DRAFT_1126456 [Mycena rosella]
MTGGTGQNPNGHASPSMTRRGHQWWPVVLCMAHPCPIRGGHQCSSCAHSRAIDARRTKFQAQISPVYFSSDLYSFRVIGAFWLLYMNSTCPERTRRSALTPALALVPVSLRDESHPAYRPPRSPSPSSSEETEMGDRNPPFPLQEFRELPSLVNTTADDFQAILVSLQTSSGKVYTPPPPPSKKPAPASGSTQIDLTLD